jgi:small nuclear ribonucleoprotein (snRNP)-like protein
MQRPELNKFFQNTPTGSRVEIKCYRGDIFQGQLKSYSESAQTVSIVLSEAVQVEEKVISLYIMTSARMID